CNNMSAFRGKSLDGGSPYSARTAGNDSDLPSEGLRFGARELRLFERPILKIEKIGTANGFKTPDGFGITRCFDPHLANIGGDGRILEGTSMAKHAKAGHQRQARHRIKHGALYVVACIIAAEIFGVVIDEGCDVLVDDRTVTG